jgi:hypothetical protein
VQPIDYQAERRQLAQARRAAFVVPPNGPNQVWQLDFSEFETRQGGVWRIGGIADYWSKLELEVFNTDSRSQARERVSEVIARLRGPAPKVAELLEDAEEDLLAFYAFPAAHWTKLRSTNPLERVNREIGRRSDVVGIFPNDQAAIRLAGALLIEQNDEWLVSRKYLSAESIALALALENEDESDRQREEVIELTAA